MLYRVGWQLIGWTGMSGYTTDLSPDEKKDLETFFEKEEKEHRVTSWRIRPVDLKGLEDIKAIYEDDQKEMNGDFVEA